jgi:predicted CXXCH cytochrome family protein
MKVYKIIGIVIVVVVCVLTLWGGISPAYDVTHPLNPHNLSAWGQNFKYMTLQVCVFCHTPHGANTEVHQSTFWNSTGGYLNLAGTGSYLLWNRDIRNSTDGFYTYTSSTFTGGSGEIRVYSLMCLSCHDGVTAISVLSNLPNREPLYWLGDDPWGCTVDGKTALCPVPESGTPYRIEGGSQSINIGERTVAGGETVADLANDHPVSFDYDASISSGDTGLAPLNPEGYVGVPEVRLFLSKETATYTSMECSTCHDPHTYEPGSREPFLVISNQNSALCLNCHIK